MKRIIIIISVISTLFTACNIKEQTNKDIIIKNIAEKEKVLLDTVNYNLNTDTANILITEYQEFVKEFSNDSLSPIYLLKAADLCISTKKYETAAKLYNKVYSNYPNYEKAPQALFLEAMTYSDFIKNESLGKLKYKEFIKKYPNHELINDAKKSLEFIGKSPEEILNILQSKDSLSNK